MGVNHILTVFYTIIGLVGISSQVVVSTILVALSYLNIDKNSLKITNDMFYFTGLL